MVVFSATKRCQPSWRKINMPFISPKDHDDILFGIKEGYDFIAASFTRTATDVKNS